MSDTLHASPSIPISGYVSKSVPSSSIKDQQLTYYQLLNKYYWLTDSNLKSPISTYSSPVDRLFESWAWNEFSTPRWSDYYVKLIHYESLYGIRSEDLYKEYKMNGLRDRRIPEDELREWLKLYRLYFL